MPVPGMLVLGLGASGITEVDITSAPPEIAGELTASASTPSSSRPWRASAAASAS